MKKVISLYLVLSVITFSIPLSGKETKGANLIIQKNDRSQVRGELIAVKAHSLLLLGGDSGADVNVDIDDISGIRIVKKSKTLLGVGLGILIGGISGAVVGAAIADKESEGFFSVAPVVNTTMSGALVGVLGAMIFGAIGGTIAAGVGKDEII